MIEIGLECFASRTAQPVLGFRDAPFEVFLARDVLPFLELARMNAEIAVGSLEQILQLVECHRIVHGQCADDSQPYRFMNQPVEIRRSALSRSDSRYLRFRMSYSFVVFSHHTSL